MSADPRRTPAFAPVLALLAGVGLAASIQPIPVPASTALLAAGVAARGGAGAAVVALAGGLLLGGATREQPPADDRDLVAEAEGVICGFWRQRADFGTRSAPLCTHWLRQAADVSTAPPRVWLELPGSSPPPPFGAVVRARGSLGRFPGFANRAEVPPGPWRLRVKSGRHLVVVDGPSLAGRSAAAVRSAVERAIAGASRDRPGVGLVRAFVLGDESGLSEDRRRALRRTGLSHLLAVSGFNVTLVAVTAALLLGGSSPRRRAIAPAAAIALYLAAVGPEPSVLRATVMAAAALAAYALGRSSSALQALSLSAAVLVALEPRTITDAGFQLSFGATAGLLLLGRRWSEKLSPSGPPGVIAIALGATLAAQAGTLPWTVGAFAEAVPSAPFWNLLFVPWASAWLLIGLAWTLLALVAPVAAGVLAPLLDLGAAPFAALESLPPSSWSSVWLPGGWITGLVAAALIAALVELRRMRGACGLAALSLALAPASTTATGVEVVFADVGQGDAALVRSGGADLVIDGGGAAGRDLGALVLRPLLASRGIERLDVALLSHADTDHCLGLLDLTAFVPIDEIWLPPGATSTRCGSRLAGRSRSATRVVATGDRFTIGGLVVEVLHPPAGGVAGSANRDSVVVRVSAGGRRVLFLGDLPADLERRLARDAGASLAADLVKIAHHGSAGSSSSELLAATGARLAVISAGARNPFGHPAPAALARIDAAGVHALRTDRDGEIVVRWRRGAPWRIETPAAPRRVAGERR